MTENKNKLGKNFKEKIQDILQFKKKKLKDLQKDYNIFTENIEGMLVHMPSKDGKNNEEFLLKEEIGRGSFSVVYRAKRLSDQKEVCIFIIQGGSSIMWFFVKISRLASQRIFKFLPSQPGDFKMQVAKTNIIDILTCTYSCKPIFHMKPKLRVFNLLFFCSICNFCWNFIRYWNSSCHWNFRCHVTI